VATGARKQEDNFSENVLPEWDIGWREAKDSTSQGFRWHLLSFLNREVIFCISQEGAFIIACGFNGCFSHCESNHVRYRKIQKH
jgi:hypothetical protein